MLLRMKGLKKEEGFGLSCLVLKEKQKKKSQQP